MIIELTGLITGIIGVIIGILLYAKQKLLSIILVIVSILMVVFASYLLATRFLNREDTKPPVDSVIVIPSKIPHNYNDQQLKIDNIKLEKNKLYDIKVGKKVKTQAYFQIKTLNEVELEIGVLLWQLPNKPRLKPGKKHVVKISLNSLLLAKSEIEVLASPMVPSKGIITRDRIFAFMIFGVIIFIIIAIILSLCRATDDSEEQKQIPCKNCGESMPKPIENPQTRRERQSWVCRCCSQHQAI